jgi:hypothetical protein
MGLIKPAVLPVGEEHLELCNRQLHKLTHFASLARALPRDEPMPAPSPGPAVDVVSTAVLRRAPLANGALYSLYSPSVNLHKACASRLDLTRDNLGKILSLTSLKRRRWLH